MGYNNFWGEENKFGDSKSMFDNKGKIIKNQIHWYNYHIENEKCKKENICNMKHLHKNFYLCK